MIMSARFIALLLALLLPATFLAGDYVPIYLYVAGGPYSVTWPPGATIPYQPNLSQPNLEPGSNLGPAIDAGLATVGSASGLSFQNVGSTSIPGTAVDGVNVISFANTAANQALLMGSVAITTVFYNAPGGWIFEFDTVGSATAPLSTLGSAAWFDVQALITHEGLHAIGFDHSPIASATIYPTLWTGALGSRTLDADDLAGVRTLYGGSPGNAAISGVLQRATAFPVGGGHVFLEDAITGRVGAGTVTFQNGSFTIQQVPPGLYRLWAEPLDGPFGPSDLYAQYWSTVGFDITFNTTAYGNTPGGSVLVVRAGQVVNVGPFVVGGPMPVRDVDQVFFNTTPTPTGAVSTVEQSAPYTGYMGIFGAGVDAIVDSGFSISGPYHQITGPSTWSSNQVSFSDKIFPISVAAGAPPGGYILKVFDPATGSQIAFPGCLEILPPPTPQAWTAAYGSPSGGSGGPLNLGASGLPSVGNSAFALTLGNTLAGETAFFAFSALPDYATLGPYFIGVDLNALLFPPTAVSLPTAPPSMTIPLPIPNIAALAGVEIYVQVMATDAGVPLGAVLSNALAIHIE